jgi:hypothetical protein
LTFQPWNAFMQRIKNRAPIRNKINLTDPAQVRAWTRRLALPPDELKAVVEKVGNSIAAVTKEVEQRRISHHPTQDAPIPSSPDEPATCTQPAQA